MLSKNSSVSRWNACRRLSSKSGNSSELGSTLRTLRSCSHWPAKLVTSVARRGSASIRRTCCSSTAGSSSLPWLGHLQQLVVGDAAPEKERQARRQLDVADAVDGCRAPRPRGSRSTRNTNCGLARITLQRPSGCRVSNAAFAPAGLVEAQQRLQVGVGHRLPIRAARQRREDLPGARRASAPGDAGRQTKIRRRLGVSPGPVALNGPVIVSVWMCGPARPVEVVGASCAERLQPHGVRHRRFWTNATATSCGPGLDRHADAQPRIDRVAGVGRLLEQRREIGVSADRRQMNPLAVDGEFDLVRVLQAAHDVQSWSDRA